MTDMANSNPSLVALLTPPGSGGIAVVLVTGQRAEATVAGVFQAHSGANWPTEVDGGLAYGHVRDGEAVADEVIVRRISATKVEINCHGGIVAAGEVIRLLVQRGAAESSAALPRGIGRDAIQREAAALLPQAVTRLAVRMLCDQLGGALSRALLAVDPSCADGAELLGELLATAELGQSLLRPRRIVLAGRPNVGKSTLFNALVGHNRTIVSASPGTTRDYVSEYISLCGFPIELIDTAGLREAGEIIESLGVFAAQEVAAGADVVVFVTEQGGTAMSEELALLPHGGTPIIVVNKCDKTDSCDSGEGEVMRISALRQQGLRELESAILSRLPSAEPVYAHGAVVFSKRQVVLLDELMRAVRDGETKAATELRSSVMT
jgi:tRNA modification GTPase